MENKHFTFGENWKNFNKSFTDERLESAKKSLRSFFQLDDFSGKTFLDIGCGSGIYSYAAHELNAAKVMSTDVDPMSVSCARDMKRIAGDPENWEVKELSILDDKAKELGQYDIVYSWGVLHHTGRMYDAIKQSAGLVAPNGYYYIAIYNYSRGSFGSRFWLEVKRRCFKAPPFVRTLAEIPLAVLLIWHMIARLQNPIKVLKNYKKKRGQTFRYDLTDWIGGYPYEYASPGEILAFVKKHYPEFDLVKLATVDDLGNNKFLFKRRGN